MKNETPIIVSFGTKKPPIFARCVERLRKNLDELNLLHDIELIEPLTQNAQRKNACLYRPEFLLNKFYEHKKPLIHIDVDTKVLDQNIIPQALKEFDVGLLQGGKVNNFSKLMYEAFFLVINYTQGGWNFLNIWYKYCLEEWHWHDHKRLMWAINTANATFADISKFIDGKLIKNGFAEGSDHKTQIWRPKEYGTNF